MKKLNNLNRYREFVPLILRIGLGLVFFVFGIDKLIRPEYWIGWMPNWIINFFPFNIDYLLYFQGVLELIVGLFLIIGLFVRFFAFISSFLLILIILTLVFNGPVLNHLSEFHIDRDIFFLILNETVLRDFGLLSISVSLIILGGGKFSIKLKKRM